jgi:hypothetical protein
MIPRPLRQFMYDIHEATDNKSITWSEGASHDAFVCTRKSYNLHISYFFDADEGVSYYNFAITGAKSASFSVSSNESDYKFMNDLHSSIQINAGDLDNIGSDFFDDE